MIRHVIVERLATAYSPSADVVSVFGESIEFVPPVKEWDKPKWHIVDRHGELAAIIPVQDGLRLIEYISPAALKDEPRIVEMTIPTLDVRTTGQTCSQ